MGALSASQNVIFSQSLRCSEITIPVSIQSTNAYIDPNINSAPSLYNALRNIYSGITDFVFNVNVAGTYNISARYCEPEVDIPSRRNTIQLLVHGITYTKDYWSGLGPPGSGFDGDTYSWIAYASKQGYPTLSIDRLGNGQSDRPNGLTVVQINSHIEVTQSLVNLLKTGAIGKRAFDKVIYVGHWLGSVVGNLHSVKYPSAVDTYMLTGFTLKARSSYIPTAITGVFLPATIAYPKKWAGQALSYFVSSSMRGANKLFFVLPNTDPSLVALNFKLRGTVTVGEFITLFEGPKAAPEYKGRVFVLTGQNDSIFCSPGILGEGTLTGRGDCGTGVDNLAYRTRELYPSAIEFDYSTPNNTGHCNILHLNAQEQFRIAHDWLNQFY